MPRRSETRWPKEVVATKALLYKAKVGKEEGEGSPLKTWKAGPKSSLAKKAGDWLLLTLPERKKKEKLGRGGGLKGPIS